MGDCRGLERDWFRRVHAPIIIADVHHVNTRMNKSTLAAESPPPVASQAGERSTSETAPRRSRGRARRDRRPSARTIPRASRRPEGPPRQRRRVPSRGDPGTSGTLRRRVLPRPRVASSVRPEAPLERERERLDQRAAPLRSLGMSESGRRRENPLGLHDSRSPVEGETLERRSSYHSAASSEKSSSSPPPPPSGPPSGSSKRPICFSRSVISRSEMTSPVSPRTSRTRLDL